MYEIWNHKKNNHTVGGFDTIENAWAYVRAFLNTEDYEVRPSKTKRNPKGAGRKPLGLPPRKRHNLNVERCPEFDDDLINARQNLARKKGVKVDTLTQKDTVYAAIHLLAYGVLPK